MNVLSFINRQDIRLKPLHMLVHRPVNRRPQHGPALIYYYKLLFHQPDMQQRCQHRRAMMRNYTRMFK